MRIEEEARRGISQGGDSGGFIGNRASLDVKLPSPTRADFRRFAAVELERMEESAALQIAQKRFIRLDNNGHASDLVRQSGNPGRGFGQVQATFRSGIKIESERIDARLDRGKSILLARHATNFDAGAAAVQPPPQTRGDHDQFRVRPRACLIVVWCVSG